MILHHKIHLLYLSGDIDVVTITPHATATSSEVTVVGQLGYKSKTASVGTTTLTSAQSGSVIMQSTNSAVVTLPATVAGLKYTIVWTMVSWSDI